MSYGGYPPAPGGGGYPPAPGGYPPPPGGGGYPPAPGGGSYPPAPGGGSYPPAPGGGSYPPPPGGGGYPPAPGGGGYPPAPGGYPPPPGGGGYPPVPGGGGYPPAPAPGGYSSGYPSSHQPTGYPPAAPMSMPSADYGSSSGSAGLPYNPNPTSNMGFAVPPVSPYYNDPFSTPSGSTGAAYAATAFRQPAAPAPGGPPMPTPQYNPTPQYTPPPAHRGHAPPPAAVAQAQGVPTQQMASMALAPTPVKRGTGTVKDKSNFDGQKEAEILRKAMKGIGTDEKAIISVVTACSNAQRQKLLIDYKTMYGKDLIRSLKSELKGKLELVVLSLMMTPEVFDAQQLRKAMKGLGTDEAVLIEILCTRTNQEIVAIKEAYKREFSRDLEKDVISETSGHFQRLLVSMAQGARGEDLAVDQAKAKEDAKALWDAGEKKWGTDESKFNVILASRSFPQLRATFDEYGKFGKYSIEQSIKREMSGDLEKGMLTIVDCVRNTPKYFSEKLYKSMKGLGTDDDTLIRVIVSRCQIDMVEIKEEFHRDHKQTLGKFIAGDTSGDYKRILLELIGGES